MKAVLEILFALLAALGLAAAGWLAFGRLVAPVGRRGQVIAVLPARGDGEELEYTLAGLGWLRGAGLIRCPVVVADAGLSRRGRAVAAALTVEHPELLVCPLAQLGEQLADGSAGGEWRERGGGACGRAVESDRGHGGGGDLSE